MRFGFEFMGRGKVTKVYYYRTATVNPLFSVSEVNMHEINKLLERLEKSAKRNGITDVSGGNHCVFEITSIDDDSKKIYVMITDSRVHVGTEVKEEIW